MANSYKSSMNLPKTDFPMRAHLPEKEPETLQWWFDNDIYGKLLKQNEGHPTFILHDGPPYANGPIHIGHTFNKTLKDFVVKSHAMQGYYAPYVPGWDCHGQPIEHMVEEKLGPEKMRETSKPEIRKMCHDWAVKYVNIQREGFKRLGVNGDWDHPYLTFQHDMEAANIEIFKIMYEKGMIYHGRKPVHWCTHCHTALAEAEIEYADIESPSLYVAFKMCSTPEPFANAGVTEPWVAIWTTTPWTLPANSGVALAPDEDYVMVKVDAMGKTMLMARKMVESVAQAAEWDSYEIVKGDDGQPVTMKGRDFAGLHYICPIRQDRVGSFIYADYVTMDTGTGCVHTAPGHGQDDYVAGEKFGLKMYMPVDDDGVLTKEAGRFAGLSTDEANPAITKWLDDQGVLIAAKKITHSYPHCWRCKNPVIFRATPQWFVSMDKTGLRDEALDQIHNHVRFIPEWAQNRIGSMVADRPDWCISRQRNWGVPIPVFHCKKCGKIICTPETLDAVIDLFREKGADAWYTEDPKDYLPAGTACPDCGCEDLVPESDILDVWWESGVTHTGVLKKRPELRYPADMYLEGSDQHRGWFQSSLLTSVGAYDRAPYESVMHCGFTMDGQGRKMSKSLGNGIDPADVEKKYGADVLRLWVSSVDFSHDVNISDEILKRTSDAYRKFRGTFRFLLGNLQDFDQANDAVAWDDLEPLDQWMMLRLQDVLAHVDESYRQYRFHEVYRTLYDFVVNDLSALYMDVCKDRLYCETVTSPRRRAAQTVLMNILDMLVRLLTPILSFTCEEVWQHYPQASRNADGRPISVQLSGWPDATSFVPQVPENAKAQTAGLDTVLEARRTVNKALEEARTSGTINKSQEADVRLHTPKDCLDALREIGEQGLSELFISGPVTLDESDALSCDIAHTDMPKCPRCWNHRELGGNPNHPDVCKRCGDALDELESAAE